mmetsp:Transcript_30165/g.99801  ORF Transcript_30165/g.99801 Transcript_30165/m.99801 type:complete len:275 (-) Transcript_30165:561-1385(-)
MPEVCQGRLRDDPLRLQVGRCVREFCVQALQCTGGCSLEVLLEVSLEVCQGRLLDNCLRLQMGSRVGELHVQALQGTGCCNLEMLLEVSLEVCQTNDNCFRLQMGCRVRELHVQAFHCTGSCSLEVFLEVSTEVCQCWLLGSDFELHARHLLELRIQPLQGDRAGPLEVLREVVPEVGQRRLLRGSLELYPFSSWEFRVHLLPCACIHATEVQLEVGCGDHRCSHGLPTGGASDRGQAHRRRRLLPCTLHWWKHLSGIVFLFRHQGRQFGHRET